MKVLALVSSVGGAGRTFLTATLATLFARRRRSVVVVEFDPSNVLGYYLGLQQASGHGMSSEENWHQQAQINQDGVIFLPFGARTLAELNRFEQHLLSDDTWLHRHLACLELPNDALILIDSPHYPSCYAQQAGQAADHLLAILPATPLPLVGITSLDAWAQRLTRPLHYVANRINATQKLQTDILAMAKQQIGARLVPYRIHADVSVPEAFALGKVVVDYAPQSQTSHDLYGLISWLETHLGMTS